MTLAESNFVPWVEHPDTVVSMLRIPIPRLLAALIFGVLLGAYINHDFAKWNVLGRDAFLLYEDHRFAASMAHPKPDITHILTAIVLAFIVAAMYELLVLIISKLTRSLVRPHTE